MILKRWSNDDLNDDDPKSLKGSKRFLLQGCKRFLHQGSKRCLNQGSKKYLIKLDQSIINELYQFPIL